MSRGYPGGNAPHSGRVQPRSAKLWIGLTVVSCVLSIPKLIVKVTRCVVTLNKINLRVSYLRPCSLKQHIGDVTEVTLRVWEIKIFIGIRCLFSFDRCR